MRTLQETLTRLSFAGMYRDARIGVFGLNDLRGSTPAILQPTGIVFSVRQDILEHHRSRWELNKIISYAL